MSLSENSALDYKTGLTLCVSLFKTIQPQSRVLCVVGKPGQDLHGRAIPSSSTSTYTLLVQATIISLSVKLFLFLPFLSLWSPFMGWLTWNKQTTTTKTTGWWYLMTFIQHLVSLRPAWLAELTPGQQGLYRGNPVSQKQNETKWNERLHSPLALIKPFNDSGKCWEVSCPPKAPCL